MKNILSLLCLLACATPIRAAAPADFAATRAILSDPLESPPLAEIRLDAPLFAATRPGFPDLRLFDSNDREQPRAVEPLYTTRPRTVRHSVAARATELRELADNRIETRLNLVDADAFPDALEIRTPLRDFIRTVRISGSTDGITWLPLVEEAEIFDYSRYMDIRRTEIPLPKNSFRHFSIEIGNASEERAQPLVRLVQQNGRDSSRAYDLLQTPFRIDGISFWRETTTQAKDSPVIQDWPHLGMIATNDPQSQTTEITLETASTPVSRLVLSTPARNFQRAAEVLVPVAANGHTQWRTVARGQFTRVDLPGYVRNDLAIDFPEQRSAQIRLVLQNADNPPLEIADVLPQGPAYRLLWLAEPAAAYRLAFGNAQLPEPDYDLFSIRTALDNGIPPLLWALAEAQPFALPEKPFDFGEFLSRPAVFGAALALAALALLVLLAKALKKADA